MRLSIRQVFLVLGKTLVLGLTCCYRPRSSLAEMYVGSLYVGPSCWRRCVVGLHALFAGWWSFRGGWAAFLFCIGGASRRVLLVAFVARGLVYALVTLLFVFTRLRCMHHVEYHTSSGLAVMI